MRSFGGAFASMKQGLPVLEGADMILYIACCTEDGGIMSCSLDDEGRLLPIGMAHLDRPMYLARDGRMLYALLRAPFEDGSGVAALEAEDGRMTDLGDCQPTHGKVSAYLCIYGGRTYTANYISGSVTRMPDRLAMHSGRGPVSGRQSSAHPHQIIPTPDGRYLAVADLGNDSVYTYDGDLREIARTRLPAGCGPRHIAFSADGAYAYAICELSSEIAVMGYHDGRFSLVEMVRTLPSSYTGESTAAAIRILGNELFVSHRGYNAIGHFRIDGASVSKVTDTPCGGDWPRDFLIAGGKLVVCNERSGNVAVFRRRGGVFAEQACSMACPAPLCVIC